MCSSTHPVALGHYSASPDEKYDSNLLLKMVIRSYSYWKVVFEVSKILDHPLTPRIALSVCSYMCIHLFVSLFLCPFVQLCAFPSVCSFICLFVCLFFRSFMMSMTIRWWPPQQAVRHHQSHRTPHSYRFQKWPGSQKRYDENFKVMIITFETNVWSSRSSCRNWFQSGDMLMMTKPLKLKFWQQSQADDNDHMMRSEMRWKW